MVICEYGPVKWGQSDEKLFMALAMVHTFLQRLLTGMFIVICKGVCFYTDICEGVAIVTGMFIVSCERAWIYTYICEDEPVK